MSAPLNQQLALGQINNAQSFAQAFSVSRETIERLQIYENLLKKWQQAHNLVATKTLAHIWSRHFADSAQLCALAPQANMWLDIGSGAGFPGMVLAIMAGSESDKTYHLVESVGRKCTFLETVKRETGAPTQIHCQRIETIIEFSPQKPDIITARALAPLDRLLGFAAPYMGEHTKLILPKGRGVDNELKLAAKAWIFDVQTIASLTEPDGRIVMVSKLEKRPLS